MPGRKPANEPFAEAFALRFLMPATSVREKFHGTVATSGEFSGRRPLSFEALLLRVARSDDSADGGIGADPERNVGEPQGVGVYSAYNPGMLGLPSHPVNDELVPERYSTSPFMRISAARSAMGSWPTTFGVIL